MTFAEDLRPVLFEARAIAGELGLRVHSVAAVVVTTSGTYTGDGNRTEVVTPIVEANSQPPKVAWLKREQLVVAGLNPGTVQIGPITPPFPGGGSPADLLTGAALAAGQVLLIRITGPEHPNGADYRISDSRFDRALHYMLQAEPVGSQS